MKIFWPYLRITLNSVILLHWIHSSSLYAGLAVALESESVDEMEQLGREERHGEVEDSVAEWDGRHQPLHGRHGDAVTAEAKRAGVKLFRQAYLASPFK